MDAFALSNNNLQIAWDATSLAAFRRCPRYYQYKILEAWRTKDESVHLTFGILFHEAIEQYDKATHLNIPFAERLRLAARYILNNSGQRDSTGTWRAWVGSNEKNRFTLLRTVIWYLCQFEHDPFKTAQIPGRGPAVELSFRFETALQTPEGKPYILCGHMDKVVQDENYFQFVDYKTTKSTIGFNFFEKYSPETQMSMYSIAVRVLFNTENVRGIINAAQVGVNFSRFVRGSTGRSKAQMDEWLHDTYYWIKRAEDCAKEGYWPQNDQACSLYGKCEFRGICSLDPASRSRFLESNFIRAERWNPLKIRGDV